MTPTRVVLARVQWRLWNVAYAVGDRRAAGPDRGRLERAEAYLIGRLRRAARPAPVAHPRTVAPTPAGRGPFAADPDPEAAYRMAALRPALRAAYAGLSAGACCDLADLIAEESNDLAAAAVTADEEEALDAGG